MSQTRLSGLAMISIENERVKELNTSVFINIFAQNQSKNNSHNLVVIFTYLLIYSMYTIVPILYMY